MQHLEERGGSSPWGAEPRRHGSEQHIAFCGYCGERPRHGLTGFSRVCARCELGLLLGASIGVAPEPSDGFIVVDDLLRLCALSQRMEQLLAVSETAAVNRQLGELLVAADVSASAVGLRAAVIHAMVAGGERAAPSQIVVRPRDDAGVRYVARVGPCEPGPAALIVLQQVV